MGVRLMKSQAQFSFHLDGGNTIDAHILSDIIDDIATLAKLTSQDIDPEAYLKMNVTAFQDGCFEIDFSAVCEFASGLFDFLKAAVPVAGGIVAALRGCFEIKKLLKGTAPKKVTPKENGTVEIENCDGEKIRTPKASAIVIENVKADQIIVNISSNALEHNPNGGFSIKDDLSNTHFSTKDIANMSKPLPINEIDVCQRNRVEAILHIRKPDLIGRSKWGFTYNNKAIEARLLDDDFLDTVHNGTTIKKGDYINATVEIFVDLDRFGCPVPGSEKYSVIKVHGTIQHTPEQLIIPNV